MCAKAGRMKLCQRERDVAMAKKGKSKKESSREMQGKGKTEKIKRQGLPKR